MAYVSKEEFDKHCDDIVQSIRDKKEYIAECVSTVKEKTDEHIKTTQSREAQVDEWSNYFPSSFKSFDDYYKSNKSHVEELQLTEDKFLFPSGDIKKARQNQISALKHANNIITAYDNICELKTNVEKTQQSQKNDSIKDFYKSKVMLQTPCSVTDIKNALSDVMSESMVSKYANALASRNFVDMESYDEAQNIVNILINHNIEATVVNDSFKQVPETIYYKQKEKLQKEFNEYSDAYVGSKSYPYVDIEHATIWIAAGIISFVSMIIGWIIAMVNDNGWFMMFTLLGLPAALIAYIGYGVIYWKRKKRCESLNNYRYEDETYAKKRQKEIYDLLDKSKNEYIFKGFEKIHQLIIRPSYEADSQLEKKLNILCDDVKKSHQIWSKRMTEVNYLPSRLSTDLLPKIIEFMETGMATDYQSAAWQAAQDSKAEEANANLLFEQRMANLNREFELRRQGRMQEEYNQKRLDEAKRATAAAQQQAEAAMRAERYAKEQADAARETAELQKSIAKNTEKAADYLKEIKDD